MKFEDTKLLDNIDVRKAFEVLLSDKGEDVTRIFIAPAENLSELGKDLEPEFIIASMLPCAYYASEKVKVNFGNKVLGYFEDFIELHRSNKKSDSEKQFLVAIGIESLKNIQESKDEFDSIKEIEGHLSYMETSISSCFNVSSKLDAQFKALSKDIKDNIINTTKPIESLGNNPKAPKA